MMSEERYLGRRFHEVRLPDGGRIILLYCWDGSEPDLSAYDGNHNIFRLTPQGEVVWQVVRDERVDFVWKWEEEHGWPEKGSESAPFGGLRCKNESTGEVLKNEQLANFVWRPGWKIFTASASPPVPKGDCIYEVNPETGVATNVSDWWLEYVVSKGYSLGNYRQ